jgi:hypothetical protein
VAGGGLTPQLVAAVGGKKLYIDAFDTLLLFEDERLVAQQILANWATASGLVIIPPQASERAFALAAAGKHAVSGAACGPALTRELARERWMPELGAAGRITAGVYCAEDCALQVSIELTEQGTEFYSAAFDPGEPWREELARRLPTVVDNGGHEQHGHGNNPVPIQGAKPSAAAKDWLETEDNALPLSHEREADLITSCKVEGALELRLAAGDGGAPRCEAVSGGFRNADPAAAACVCAALSKEVQGAGRRHASIAGPEAPTVERRTTATGLEVAAQALALPRRSATYAQWFFPASASLSHCFVGRSQPLEQTDLNVTVDFDGQGRATKATIGDLEGLLSKAERECVQQLLMTARAACPTGPSSSGLGAIWLSLRKPEHPATP